MEAHESKPEKERASPAVINVMNDQSGLFFAGTHAAVDDETYVVAGEVDFAAAASRHTLALPDTVQWRYLIPGEDYPDFDQIQIRYLSPNDQYKAERDSWLQNIFQNIVYYNLNYQETHVVSRAVLDFDLIIVGGNDALRAGKFLKANIGLFGSRPRIALMCRSDPRRRAQLLNAGYDDVLDCARMSAEECIMRIFAIWRRHKLVTQVHAAKKDALIALAALAKPEKNLTDAEVRVLAKLSENAERVISYVKLCDVASKGYQSITLNHLKVIVSNLRKKLSENWEISSVNSFGYMLSKTSRFEL